MSFPWLVALRFLKEGRMQSVLIVVGVGVGIGVMVFLSALITGLQTGLIQQTLGTQPHVTIKPLEDAARPQIDRNDNAVVGSVERPAQRLRTIPNWPQVLKDVKAVPGVVVVTPSVTGSGFASRGSADKPIVIRGVEPETFDGVVPVSSKMQSGAFSTSGTDAVIGVDLAKDLGVSVGDKIRLSGASGNGEPYTVRGIFDLQNKDVNQRWVLVSLRSAQTLLGLSSDITSIELKVDEIFNADATAAILATRTGLVADSWMKVNRQLMIALRSQSSSSSTIQFFVIVAVAFGIASVLAVSVVQKSREIGILKAMGAQTDAITKVFVIQGFLVGILGSIIGSLLGAGLALLFMSFARNADGSATFPVDLSSGQFIRAVVVAAVVGVLSAVVPARRAARLDPAVVIRYG